MSIETFEMKFQIKKGKVKKEKKKKKKKKGGYIVSHYIALRMCGGGWE